MPQQFKRGDVVRIAEDLGQSMSHFGGKGETAVVMGSYRDQYGGNDRDETQQQRWRSSPFPRRAIPIGSQIRRALQGAGMVAPGTFVRMEGQFCTIHDKLVSCSCRSSRALVRRAISSGSWRMRVS